MMAILTVLAGTSWFTGCGRPEPKPDVQEQITRIQSESEEDRYVALSHLQSLGAEGGAAVQPLRTLLAKSKDDTLAAEIAKTLGAMGPSASAAVPELTALLGRKAMWPRYAAVDALGRMGPAAAPALPAILKLTKDPNREVAAAAREAARRLQRSTKRK
ncbi:HEAT repeat domain-containing protein [bacterium]|nr:HEAT repeat domain-containing protein [bacterium]